MLYQAEQMITPVREQFLGALETRISITFRRHVYCSSSPSQASEGGFEQGTEIRAMEL